MVKTLCFHCRAHRFYPWSESSTCHLAKKKKTKKTKSLFSMELLKKSRENRYITNTPVSK